jgi:succinate dehydrogenase / fumarate reductase cytochrome b subunit
MTVVGFHLRHGISSAFQSLGVEHDRLGERLVTFGTVLAVVIGGGFALIPLWVYFLGSGS